MHPTHILLAMALSCLAASCLSGQQLANTGGGGFGGGEMGEGLGGGRPDFMDRVPSFGSESATGLFALPVEITNRRNETVSYGRAEFGVTGKIHRSPKWSLTANSSYSHLGIEHNAGALPTRLVKLRTGLTGTLMGPPFLLFSTSLGYASDFETPTLRDLTLTQLIMASFKLDAQWSISTGAFYSYGRSNSVIRALRYFPIPFISATWRPNEKLRVTLGLPSFSVDWKPNSFFELQASYALPFSPRLTLTQRPAAWLVLREYFGRVSEDYSLTAPFWEDYTQIELSGWGLGASVELLPFAGVINEPQLRNSSLKLTYQFGFLQRWRIYTYDDNDNRFTYELAPSHNFALTITLAF